MRRAGTKLRSLDIGRLAGKPPAVPSFGVRLVEEDAAQPAAIALAYKMAQGAGIPLRSRLFPGHGLALQQAGPDGVALQHKRCLHSTPCACEETTHVSFASDRVNPNSGGLSRDGSKAKAAVAGADGTADDVVSRKRGPIKGEHAGTGTVLGVSGPDAVDTLTGEPAPVNAVGESGSAMPPSYGASRKSVQQGGQSRAYSTAGVGGPAGDKKDKGDIPQADHNRDSGSTVNVQDTTGGASKSGSGKGKGAGGPQGDRKAKGDIPQADGNRDTGSTVNMPDKGAGSKK